MIPITKPFLPPEEDYKNYLGEIWSRNWLTNNGPLVNELELKLKSHLGLDNFLFLTNGTIAIQIAIKALKLTGEIITTPFSYVATTSSIVWENAIPVFVDIESSSLNIDASKIEASINSKTSAILATHVYGNPCEIDAIAAIAQKHNLSVIYDAAHCFGSMYKNRPVLSYGDVSTTSFHATKLFHTIEGGAVTAKDPLVFNRMAYMRNFGHDGPDKFSGVGINAKNSEFHAAMGLCNLPWIDKIKAKRKADHEKYDVWMSKLPVRKPTIGSNSTYNYSYYPVIFETKSACELVFNRLMDYEIFARRYFYPVLSSLSYVEKANMPIAEDIAPRVLCLPLYYQMLEEDINLVGRRITKILQGG